MSTEKTIETLYQEYVENKISKEEFEELIHLLGSPEKEKKTVELLDSTWAVMFDPQPARVLPLYKRKWYIPAAAAILCIVIAGTYFMTNKPVIKNITFNKSQNLKNKNETTSKKNVILTLANGREIILDSAANGTLAQQSNVQIIKLDNGQIAYNSTQAPASQIEYNTISIPGGVLYKLILEDGSKVWLNALSTLHFPASFSRKERVVELEGEAYFEIAKNADRPFIVNIKSTLPNKEALQVKVLGTHFNINAYNDEPLIKTTLLEGSIEILKGTTAKKMIPGQQAIVSELPGEPDLKLVNTDVKDAVAWKEGRFSFHGNNIQSVMRDLSRWYNVNVKYKGEIPDEQFVGQISRSRYEKIDQVLKILERTRIVQFDVVGKNITVMPFKNK